MGDDPTLPDWLRPTEYSVDFDKHLTIQERAPGLWALVSLHGVWDFRAADWTYEPGPSSRTTRFKGRTRRPLADCIAAADELRGPSAS